PPNACACPGNLRKQRQNSSQKLPSPIDLSRFPSVTGMRPQQAAASTFTLFRRWWFVSIIGWRTPTQLVAQCLIVAPAGHLYQSEGNRGPPHDHAIIFCQGHRLLTVHN